jgi:hypothetical protein
MQGEGDSIMRYKQVPGACMLNRCHLCGINTCTVATRMQAFSSQRCAADVHELLMLTTWLFCCFSIAALGRTVFNSFCGMQGWCRL